MQNLIGNGLKYHGDEPPHAQRLRAAHGKEWTVSVRDNGIGIAPQHHERIFEIFKRLHDQQEYPGTGIGLADLSPSRPSPWWERSGWTPIRAWAAFSTFTIPETMSETGDEP